MRKGPGSVCYKWSFVTQIFHNGQPSHGGDSFVTQIFHNGQPSHGGDRLVTQIFHNGQPSHGGDRKSCKIDYMYNRVYQNTNFKNDLSKWFMPWSSVLIRPLLDCPVSIYCEMFLVEYFINTQSSNISYHFLFRFF